MELFHNNSKTESFFNSLDLSFTIISYAAKFTRNIEQRFPFHYTNNIRLFSSVEVIMNTEIKRINKEDTWRLRHEVMWPDKDLDYIKLADDDAGIHFGLFKEGKLISVISVFIYEREVQFRKFATLQQEQGKGYGSKLLTYIMAEVVKEGVKRIWCNARKNKVGFYQKFGLKEMGTCFVKGGKDYTVMEKMYPR